MYDFFSEYFVVTLFLNELLELSFLRTVKWFQVFLFYTKNSIFY